MGWIYNSNGTKTNTETGQTIPNLPENGSGVKGGFEPTVTPGQTPGEVESAVNPPPTTQAPGAGAVIATGTNGGTGTTGGTGTADSTLTASGPTTIRSNVGYNGTNGGAWNPSVGSPGSLAAPEATAYNPQNAQSLLNKSQQNAGLLNGLGTAAQTAGGTLGGATTFNAAGIAPLMLLNGGATINQNATNQNVAAQQASINNLNNIASGNGPNAATMAAAQQAQQNSAAQMAAIASAGGNPALAARNAQAAAAQANQQGAQNAVLGSANEQLGAQGTLQSALGTLASQGQAIPLAQAQLIQQAALANQGIQSTGAQNQAQLQQQTYATNAGAQNANTLQAGNLSQQTALANQQAFLSGHTADANQQNAMLSAAMQQSSFDTNQNEAYQQQYQQAQENIAALNANQGIAQMQQTGQIVGSGIGAAGAIIGGLSMGAAAAASDKRLKTNIKSAKRDVYSFLDSLGISSTNKIKNWNK